LPRCRRRESPRWPLAVCTDHGCLRRSASLAGSVERPDPDGPGVLPRSPASYADGDGGALDTPSFGHLNYGSVTDHGSSGLAGNYLSHSPDDAKLQAVAYTGGACSEPATGQNVRSSTTRRAARRAETPSGRSTRAPRAVAHRSGLGLTSFAGGPGCYERTLQLTAEPEQARDRAAEPPRDGPRRRDDRGGPTVPPAFLFAATRRRASV
jgi:hypothetical protein